MELADVAPPQGPVSRGWAPLPQPPCCPGALLGLVPLSQVQGKKRMEKLPCLHTSILESLVSGLLRRVLSLLELGSPQKSGSPGDPGGN